MWLRTAIRAGAAGYFLWPKEREEQLGARRGRHRRARATARRGTVVAVGGRGGRGSVRRDHRRGVRAVRDPDRPRYGVRRRRTGAGRACGDDAEPVRTFADAAALGEGPGPEQLEGALWGARAGSTCAPFTAARRARPSRTRRSCGSFWTRQPRAPTSRVVVHLPRALGTAATSRRRAHAVQLVEVLTLQRGPVVPRDLPSPGGLLSRSTLAAGSRSSPSTEPPGARSPPATLRRVLGEPALAVFRYDPRRNAGGSCGARADGAVASTVSPSRSPGATWRSWRPDEATFRWWTTSLCRSKAIHPSGEMVSLRLGNAGFRESAWSPWPRGPQEHLRHDTFESRGARCDHPSLDGLRPVFSSPKS